MAKEEKDKKAKAPRTPEQIEAEKAAKAAKQAEHAAAAAAARKAESGAPKASKAKEKEEEQAAQPFPPGYVPRLYKRYLEEIVPALQEKLKIKNRMAVPRITKVVVSMGLGKAIAEKTRLETGVKELTAITGQKALICQARKSVSNFKLRQGMEIGVKVTLRGQKMWEFLDRLIILAIPRVKDFRGLSPKAFDGRGNYNLGLTEQTVFPEIRGDQVTFHQGLAITIVTTAENDTAGFELLSLLGMPFRTDAQQSTVRKAG